MKKNLHSAAGNDANIDMTSMLDIVFILLIFFIVTTSFVKETGLAAKRPLQSDATPTHPSLQVYISESGRLTMNQREIEMSRLVANVQSFLASNPTDSITIKAHPKAKHGVIVQAMNEAKLAGIGSVSVMVGEKS